MRLIQERCGARPFDLTQELGISPQAIHRHLSALLASGSLERRGRGPLTRYYVAGIADLDAARWWQSSAGKPSPGPGETLCETRDVFAGRLGHLVSLAKEGLAPEELPLVISVVGEVGNNCFDHNLGNWRDVPGCWLQAQPTGRRLWLCVADRGQGVLRSLSRVDPGLEDEQSALVAAFERNISGRAPEQRGNGLKFVRNVVSQGDGRGLACRSGKGLLAYGRLGEDCRRELLRFSAEAGGTVTLIAWRLG